jgi:hypothetical protein
MALDRNATYPGRYDAPTTDQPQGGFKDRTTPTSADGSYMSKDWLNDWSAFFGRLFNKTGVAVNNVLDTAQDSQYYNALEAAVGYGRKRLNANGNFLVNQRGAVSFTPSLSDYTSDNWKYDGDLDGGSLTNNAVDVINFTLGQSDVAGNPILYCDFSGNVSGGSGNEELNFKTFIEGVEKISNEQFSISFWAKGSVGGTVIADFIEYYGTGGSPSATTRPLGDNPIVLTTGWQKYTFTGTGTDMSSKSIGYNGDDRIRVGFITELGATAAATKGLTAVSYTGTVSIANVQIELGRYSSKFELLPQQEELAWSQRYYQRWQWGGNAPIFGRGGSAGSFLSVQQQPVAAMLTAPSLILTGAKSVTPSPLDGGATPSPATFSVSNSFFLLGASRGAWVVIGTFPGITNGGLYGIDLGGDAFTVELSSEF